MKIAICFLLALALNCYQCSGSDPKDPFQCNEWLSSDIDIEPQACDNVYAAKYCIKHVGRFEGTPKVLTLDELTNNLTILLILLVSGL